MKSLDGLRLVTSKNWLDFGGAPAHVTLGLSLGVTAALAEVCAL